MKTSAQDERNIFGTAEEYREFWRKCCDLAIEEAAAAGTLGKLSWAEWTALCSKQRHKIGGAK